MSAEAAYALGVLTPFAALMVWMAWDWSREAAGLWWRRQRPTLGRARCTLAGHNFCFDHGWVICRRCGHAKRHPDEPTSALILGDDDTASGS